MASAGALVAVPTAPAQAGDGQYGKACHDFRGALRCARIYGAGSERIPDFLVSIGVHDGDRPNVKRGSVQRRTPDGWTVVARATGDGPESGIGDQLFVHAGECSDLRRGHYRVRGKVAWASQGVHYTRRETSKAVPKRRFC